MTVDPADIANRAGERFQSARVAKRALSLIAGHWVFVLTLGIPLVSAPRMLDGWLHWLTRTAAPLSLAGLVSFLPNLLQTAMIALFQAAFALKVGPQCLGAPARTTDQIFHQLRRRAVAVLIYRLVFDLGLIAGLALLVLPGLIVQLAWSVAAPVLILEGLGPLRALGRSRTLTAGSRGAIFGLELIVFVGGVVLSVVCLRLLGGGQFLGAPHMLAVAGREPLYWLVCSPLLALVTNILYAAGAVSAYLELVGIKGGLDSTEFSTAFD